MMANFNKLTINNLPARIEFHARDRGLTFDLPAWDEFKKDIANNTSVEAMRKKWQTHWVTMQGWTEIYKEGKQ